LLAANALREALGEEATATKEAINAQIADKKSELGVAANANEKTTKKAADDAVAGKKSDKDTADTNVKNAQTAIATEKGELPELLADKNSADAVVSDLINEIGDLEEELKGDPKPSADRILEIEAQLEKDRAALGTKTDKTADTAYGRAYLAKEAYDKQVIKINGLTENLNNVLLPAQEAADRAYVDQKKERDIVYGLYSALENADTTAASLDDTIKDLQKQVVVAQKELQEATAVRQAAEAKLDEPGKAYTEKVYEEKKIRAELQKEIVDKVQAELDESEAKLQEIEEEIANYVADYTTNYDAAVAAEKEATKNAADALKEFDEAIADLKVKTEEYKTALENVEKTIPHEIASAITDLQLALSDERLNSSDYEVVEAARARIARLEAVVEDYQINTTAAGAEALVNATAKLNIATQRFQTAEEDWTEKALLKTAAMDALNTAKEKRAAAYKKLVTMYLFEGDGLLGAKLKKDVDGKVTYDKANARYTSDGKYECNVEKTGEKDLYNRWNKAMMAVDAKKAHLEAVQKDYEKALEELDDAIVAFEYTHGYKPGEQTPEEKKEEAAEEAAEAEVVAKFSDVDAGKWYTPHIAHVYKKGIMTGYADGKTFGTFDTLQRQDFVMTLWNMSGRPVVNTKTNFKDVEKGSYYENAINWAYSEGIVKGYTDTEFGVGKNITREDFTVMLYRYEKFPPVIASIDSFKDASKVSFYAVDAVKWAVATGAIKGKDNGTVIDPQAPIVRCEAAQILDIITG
jgi:hypothetical protein